MMAKKGEKELKPYNIFLYLKAFVVSCEQKF